MANLLRNIWIRRALTLLSMALFAFCLMQTALKTGEVRLDEFRESVELSSYEFLKTGWVGLVYFFFYCLPILILFAVLNTSKVSRKKSQQARFNIGLLVLSTLVWMVISALYSFKLGQMIGYGGWLANPGIAFAWLFVLFDEDRTSTFRLSCFNLLLMLSFLVVKEFPADKLDAPISFADLKLGYWLWVASAAVMVIASLPLGEGRAYKPDGLSAQSNNTL